MKLRSEVEEAISEAASDCTDVLFARNADDLEAAGMRPTLLALVELGVRLGVADCCDPACTIEDISQETVNDILQAQPEVEGEGNG